MSQRVTDTDFLITTSPVIPVLALDNPDTAVPIAKALVAGGLRVLEITLRTSNALSCIEAVAKALPDAIVGAGTVINAEQARQVVDAGARFAVSPGLGQNVVMACDGLGLPLLPGAVTASEIMQALDWGFRNLKFFPAEASGGIPMLKAFYGPLPQVRFCPTGGVKLSNLKDYLSLPNVACAGGSWLVTADDIVALDVEAIQKRAQDTVRLAREKR